MNYRFCFTTWRHIVSLLRKSPRRSMARCRSSVAEPAMIELLEDRSLLSPILVTNLADAGEGSLRAAVEHANNAPGDDLIKFDRHLTGRISLSTGQMEITEDLTIDGPGASRITVSGNRLSRIFSVVTGVEFSIADITLADGRSESQDNIGITLTRGGAILNVGGIVRLSGVWLLNNMAIDNGTALVASDVVGGGAIVNSENATLFATDCLFVGNSVSGGTRYAFGGAIANVTDSSASIKNCTFISNVSTSGATNYGGAIGSFGNSQLTVSGCSFLSNSALGAEAGQDSYGGAIASRPGTVDNSGSTTTIEKSLFQRNRAVGGAGRDSASGGNAGGGAIFNFESTLFVSTSLLKGNQAIGGKGTQGGDALGGAIYNKSGETNISRTKIIRNRAIGIRGGIGVGGGIYNTGTLALDRSTLRRVVANRASTSNNNIYGEWSITASPAKRPFWLLVGAKGFRRYMYSR